MAVVEHLLYGENPIAGTARCVLLAQSPGLSQRCSAEIVRLCERWRSTNGVTFSRPVFLSFPLTASMSALPGRLHTVIQVNAKSQLLFHAAVLTESDYAAFNYNPFRLALEDIFIQQWTPGSQLKRLQVEPSSLAPLVSPLPSERDADLIDEALRLFFAERKLLLPLEFNDVESDRFLALLMAALPNAVKRDIRFASLSASGDNQYTLAALYQRECSFQNWYRLLMASISGPVPQVMAEYLDDVRSCLVGGDLLGLEKLSRRVDKQDASKKESERESPQSQSAKRRPPAISGRTPPAVKSPRPSQVAPAVTSASSLAASSAVRPFGQAAVATGKVWSRPQRRVVPKNSQRAAGRSRPERYRVGHRASGRVWLLLVTSILLVGAGYWLSHGGWLRMMGWFKGSEPRLSSGSVLEVVDVGAIYTAQLEGVLGADFDVTGKRREKNCAKAMKLLKVGAAEDLNQQSRLIVDLTAQGIQPQSSPLREVERLNSLAERGEILERELKRLMLSYYSFENELLWRDLSDLDQRKLSARYDSLRQREPHRLQLVAEELGLANQIADVRYARHRITEMTGVVELFARKRMDAKWITEAEKIARNLTSHSTSMNLAAYRACALAMARLKKAEIATDFGNLAFERDVSRDFRLPRDLYKSLTGLRTEVGRYGTQIVPTLAVATVEFYDSLLNDKLNWRRASPEQFSALIKVLEANKAVAFDPERYALHVDWVRFCALLSLLERDYDPTNLPTLFFPAEDRTAALSFLSLRESEPSGDEWREVARLAALPFYAHWAAVEAKRADRRRVSKLVEFDRAFDHIVDTTLAMNQLAQQGQDWLTARAQVLADISQVQQRYHGRFGDDLVRREKLSRLETLTTILNQPLTLALSAVTVRLAPEVLDQPTEVVLTLADDKGLSLQRTAPFPMGPAAPASSGWVGTLPITLDLVLLPGQPLRAQVRTADEGTTLLTVKYGYEGDPPPGSLTVSKAGRGTAGEGLHDQLEAGTLLFKMTDSYWRQLKLPDLRAESAASEQP